MKANVDITESEKTRMIKLNKDQSGFIYGFKYAPLLFIYDLWKI